MGSQEGSGYTHLPGFLLMARWDIAPHLGGDADWGAWLDGRWADSPLSRILAEAWFYQEVEGRGQGSGHLLKPLFLCTLTLLIGSVWVHKPVFPGAVLGAGDGVGVRVRNCQKKISGSVLAQWVVGKLRACMQESSNSARCPYYPALCPRPGLWSSAHREMSKLEAKEVGILCWYSS